MGTFNPLHQRPSLLSRIARRMADAVATRRYDQPAAPKRDNPLRAVQRILRERLSKSFLRVLDDKGIITTTDGTRYFYEQRRGQSTGVLRLRESKEPRAGRGIDWPRLIRTGQRFLPLDSFDRDPLRKGYRRRHRGADRLPIPF